MVSPSATPGPSSPAYHNNNSGSPQFNDNEQTTSRFSSPSIDTLKRTNHRSKRRTLNLVNPANADDFSTSFSITVEHPSPPKASDEQDENRGPSTSPMLPPRFLRETTPVNQIQGERFAVSTGRTLMPTPGGSGVGEYGVRGILRPSGTPGSGNGVRFGQKNRFRVITPNNSISTYGTPPRPSPAPAPTPRATFFSALMSVVPISSPLRSSAAQPSTPAASTGLGSDSGVSVENANQSWEVPGEEGEISLIGDSTGDTAQFDRSDEGEEGEEEELDLETPAAPWSGFPEVHSSPLSLPQGDGSRDISLQDLAPGSPGPFINTRESRPTESVDSPTPYLPSPSRGAASTTRYSLGNASSDSASFFHINMPDGAEDASNLLSTSFDGISGGMSGMNTVETSGIRQHMSLTASTQVDAMESPMREGMEMGDESSFMSVEADEDNNPTIRRKLSVSPESDPTKKVSPTTDDEHLVQLQVVNGLGDHGRTPSPEVPLKTKPIIPRHLLSPSPAPRRASNVDGKGTRTPSPLGGRSSNSISSPFIPPKASPSEGPRFTSIFADMSAEQAELAWPLASTAPRLKPQRQTGSGTLGDTAMGSPATLHATEGEDTAFLSVLGTPVRLALSTLQPQKRGEAQLSPSPGPSPANYVDSSPATPIALGDRTSNGTVYLDAETTRFFTPSATPHHLRPSASAPIARSGSGSGSGSVVSSESPKLSDALMAPSRNLYEAHNSHTTALQSQLELMQRLAAQLQLEVSERDQALAKVNVRLVESEMKAAKLAQAQAQARETQDSPATTTSSVRLPGSGSGTDEDQAVVVSRDRERSQSASPTKLNARSAARRRSASPDKLATLNVDPNGQEQLEQQRRDQELVQELARARDEAESAREREIAMHAELHRLESAAEEREEAMRSTYEAKLEQEGGKVRDLEIRLRKAIRDQADVEKRAEVAEAAREEVERDNAREGEQEVREWMERCRDLAREMTEVNREARGMEAELVKERTSSVDMERIANELKVALQAAKDEAKRLRAESANKDLEIATLTRRKVELKEDREMLNVALDSKQQEVELLKRKIARANKARPSDIAISTNLAPLGTSQRTNLGSEAAAGPSITDADITTPLARNTRASINKRHSIAPASSLTYKSNSTRYTTPIPNFPQTPLAAPIPQAQGIKNVNRHGVALHASTQIKDRVLRRGREVGTGPRAGERGSLRGLERSRESLLV